MRDSVGLAVFVKTPGMSPIKTRLATSIGQARAEEFYRRSVAAVEDCMTRLKALEMLQPHWAVAEPDALAHPMWSNHTTISQGQGSLGLRLAKVFDALSRRHEIVMAIGGDSPQLSVGTFELAIRHLNGRANCSHVIGRCHDGGFYLVGSNRRVPTIVWNQVTYSEASTADELVQLLSQTGRVGDLGRLSDVDTHTDLSVLVDELQCVESLTSPQQCLLSWLQDVLAC